jgi:hypothetical protein
VVENDELTDSKALALEPDGEDAADDAKGTGLDHASPDVLRPSHADVHDALKGEAERACGERVDLVGERCAGSGDIRYRVGCGVWLLKGGFVQSLGTNSEACEVVGRFFEFSERGRLEKEVAVVGLGIEYGG